METMVVAMKWQQKKCHDVNDNAGNKMMMVVMKQWW